MPNFEEEEIIDLTPREEYVPPTFSSIRDVEDQRDLRIVKDRGLRSTAIINCVLPGTAAQTAANYNVSWFISDRTYKIVSVTERHDVAGTDAGAVNVDVLKVDSGTDGASGTSLLTGTINLKATADTNQTGTLVATPLIIRNQSVVLKSTGTLTAVQGVTITIILRGL